jgi:diadenosine tetraphosphate (Ap4A) HIT family hydrolase
MDSDQTGHAPAEGCVFCDHAALDVVLAQTDHFLVVADHAPLVEGHLLIIPRAHYACYGAVPDAFEDEFLALKRRVRHFLATSYQMPAFFEHGVFRQTVYHAHLHAMPFGALDIELSVLAAENALLVGSLADVRRWYREHGHYFYLEEPALDGAPPVAAVFPPEEQRYRKVLGTLREAAGRHGPWQPPPLRRLTGRASMRAVAERWRAFADEAS